jgi:hypothetical protein
MMMCAFGEVVAVPFRFQVAAAGGAEPDFQVPAGAVSVVTRDGSAGLYSVTFREKYPIFLGVVGTVLEATPAHDLIVKTSVASYSATTGVLTLTVVGADGTTAAEDVIDNDWVFVVAYFIRRTTAFGATGAIPA